MIVAVDILILFFAGRDHLTESPGFNHFFLLAECIVFFTFAVILLYDRQFTAGIIQSKITILYGYILFCERKSFGAERISIQHLGIKVPGFPFDSFIHWTEINRVDVDHQVLIINLRRGNINYQFNLARHLKLEELAIIQLYCRHYLLQKQ